MKTSPIPTNEEGLKEGGGKTSSCSAQTGYEAERDDVEGIIEAEKSQYYNNNVQECEGDQKKLFNIVDKLLNRGKSDATT